MIDDTDLDAVGQTSDGVTQSQALLSSSAQGAKFLILLQIGSRALTFALNQVLLRYMPPELLGISTQLELYSISVLYFARESLRVALQRQDDYHGTQHAEKGDLMIDQRQPTDGYIDADTPGGRVQSVVNISYVATGLGIPIAYGLAVSYLKNADSQVLQNPNFQTSLYMYAIATILELCTEPCFVIVQQKMLYKIRASAETSATIARCLLTCGSVIWFSTRQRDVGVLPFAIGQMGYAMTLGGVYYTRFCGTQYLFSYFSQPLLKLGTSLFIQCGVKHILNQGDSYLIAALANLEDQGAYALASNYGGLIARMLFQPIEESSRNLFAQLLATKSNGKPGDDGMKSASIVLRDILRLYVLLSIVAAALGPTIAPLLLRIVAGSRWSSTNAGYVLSTYCYYIPLLALNGVTEAFISSVASGPELHRQSIWMFTFSIGYASVGYIFLRVLQWGAEGLVWANVVNMTLRILWSLSFIRQYWTRNGSYFQFRDALPTAGSISAGVSAAVALRTAQRTFNGGITDLVKSVALASPFALLL